MADMQGDAETERLAQQVQRGDFAELRQYLARTLRAQDWQDRCFVLNLVSSAFPVDALLSASAAEPEAADLYLLLGAYYFKRVWECRGGKQAEETTPEQFYAAEVQTQNMMDCLSRVYPLEPSDPTPHVFAVRGLNVFTSYHDDLKREYEDAVRLAPGCVPAHYSMVNARSEKWGGSHEESLQLARAVLRAGRLGSDVPACLFLAHFLVRQFARLFEKNKPEADRYVQDPAVTSELNQALDRWIGGNYEVRRSSLPYLHQAALWYYLSGDTVRLKRLLTLTGPAPCDYVWKQIGDPAKVHRSALLRISPAQPQAAPVPEKKAGIFGWLKK